jgi:hypothetical protein
VRGTIKKQENEKMKKIIKKFEQLCRSSMRTHAFVRVRR